MSLQHLRQTAFDAAIRGRPIPVADKPFLTSIRVRLLSRKQPDIMAFARDWELNYDPSFT